MVLKIPMMKTRDAVKKKPIKGKFKASANADARFFKQLKKMSKQAAKIVNKHAVGATIKDPVAMQRELEAYANKLESSGWAARQSAEMLKTVSNSNKRAYQKNSKAIGDLLQSEVAESYVGDLSLKLLQEQVALIKSVPLELGQRAQEIAAKNFLEGNRAQPDQEAIDYLVNQMGKTEDFAINRAKLIARTETARANSAFVQGRALAVGSQAYVWRTSMDGAERKSHAEMNGKTIYWNKPPTLSDGMKGHAGTFPNCRCYADPILPDLD